MTELAEHPRIVIADDHPPTRAAVRGALAEGGFLVTGEASDAAGAVSMVQATAPDIALLDVRMPGGGISAAVAIVSQVPQTAVVMLTVSEDDEDLFAALRVGALGYVLKGGNLAELPGLLRMAVLGEPVLHGATLARVLVEFRASERSRLFKESERVRLSARERDVLSLLERGATTAEIAASLYIAKVTVRSHIAAICRKLRLPDRDAALREFRLGVTPPVTTAGGVIPDSHATPGATNSPSDDPALGTHATGG